MVDTAPTLARAGSVVPVATHQQESCIIPVPLSSAWETFKTMKLEKVMPNSFKETTWTTGGPGQLDSVLKIVYNDGAIWEVSITEVSNLRHTVGYTVLSTEPAHSVTSIQGLIVLRPVTDDNTTMIEWGTDFSNDADAGVIEDQRFKKLDFFKDMKKTLGGK